MLLTQYNITLFIVFINTKYCDKRKKIDSFEDIFKIITVIAVISPHNPRMY